MGLSEGDISSCRHWLVPLDAFRSTVLRLPVPVDLGCSVGKAKPQFSFLEWGSIADLD